MERNKQKVLIFGAGVIGAYLAHVLISAGNQVTILAREQRARSLNQNGLVISHPIQRKVTRDTVEAVTDVEGREFDVVFVVMPNNKLEAALSEVCKLHAKLLVLVGNNISPAKTQEYLEKNAKDIHQILFGFQATAGKKNANGYVCERLGAGMDLGQLHGEVSSEIKCWIGNLFTGTKYKLKWQKDMESYLLCHLAAILPIGYLSYICGGNLRKSTHAQRRLMFEASHEAYEMLKTKGITIYPLGAEKFYEDGIQGKLMTLIYFIMAKTSIGDRMACEHCRNCVSEMEQFDVLYKKLMEDYPKERLKAWISLRSQMPSWADLHRIYGN